MYARNVFGIALLVLSPLCYSGQPKAGEVQPKSRAEVLVELALWQRAGLHRFLDDRPTDFDEYERRVKTFHGWMSGPEYQSELDRLRGARGAIHEGAVPNKN